ncbi:hypothetical protein ACFL4X_00600 [Gemmatimonadota bacterium]
MTVSADQEKMNSMLVKYGRALEDYGYMEEFDSPRDSDTGPVLGRIAVLNKKTGSTNVYKAGLFSCWTEAFEKDLAAGLI